MSYGGAGEALPADDDRDDRAYEDARYAANPLDYPLTADQLLKQMRDKMDRLTPHTPGPWKYSTNIGPTKALIVEADGATIVELTTNVAHRDTFAANAAFIVRACNAHDDLLAALTEIIEHKNYEGFGDPASRCLYDESIARAAIAQVQA